MKISCNFWQKAKKKQFWERWPIQHISANSAINCAIVKSQNSRSPCHNPQNMCRAWWNGCGGRLLWQPYGIGPALIFLPSDFYLLLLSFFLSSPNLRLDVYHTSTHGVALVANLECMSEMCCTRLGENTGCKNYHFGIIAQLCWAVSSQLRHVSIIGKKIVKYWYLLHMSS